MYKRSRVQSPLTPYTKNWLVSWSDDNELLSGVDAIGWNSLSKKSSNLPTWYHVPMLLPFYISKSHLVISLYQFENSTDLQSIDASLQEPRGMLLRPSQPMAEFFHLLFFFLTNHLVANLKFYVWSLMWEKINTEQN